MHFRSSENANKKMARYFQSWRSLYVAKANDNTQCTCEIREQHMLIITIITAINNHYLQS